MLPLLLLSVLHRVQINLFVIVYSIFLGFHKASKFVASILCDNK